MTERKFKCPLCTKRYQSIRDLDKHCRRVHLLPLSKIEAPVGKKVEIREE